MVTMIGNMSVDMIPRICFIFFFGIFWSFSLVSANYITAITHALTRSVNAAIVSQVDL